MADDLAPRYAPLMSQAADIYADDSHTQLQLKTATVTAEEWDDENRLGGHFWFDLPSSAPPVNRDDATVWARDSDGLPIEIIFHFDADGRLSWGEWLKVHPPRKPGQLIAFWPPSFIYGEPF